MTTEKTARFEQQIPYLYGEGVASNAMDSLSTGTLLVGIALLLGATPMVIGVLGALPFLANVLQIPSIFVVEKYQNRKRIALIACWIARSALLGIALLYFVPDTHMALGLFLILCVIRFGGSAIAGCAWNSWMNDLIPKERLGRFFGKRMMIMTLFGTVIICAASFFIENWEEHHGENDITPYAVLFFLAFVAAVISNLMIMKLYHPQIKRPSIDKLTMTFSRRDLLRPWHHQNFRHLIIFMILWNFAVNLAAPFFTVFMMSSLSYSMSDVIRLTVLTQVVYMVGLRIWGTYSDRFSNKAIIRICGPIFGFCFLGWTFITFPDPHAYSFRMIILLHILMGFATSGINLATNNIALKLCPDEHSTSYLATNSLFSSLSAGLASLVGGALIQLVDKVQVIVDLRIITSNEDETLPTLALGSWDFFFFLAFILSFAALAYLFRLQEEGDIERRVVLRTLVYDTFRLMQNISSVAGLRAQTGMPQPDSTGPLGTR